MDVSYLLVVRVCGKREAKVLGRSWVLEDGYYVYVGSARLARPYLRVLRHFNPTKKSRWHIDHIISHDDIQPVVGIILYGVSEDSLYGTISGSSVFEVAIPRFGSTDKRTHTTHFFRAVSLSLLDVFRELLALAKSLKPLLIELLFEHRLCPALE